LETFIFNLTDFLEESREDLQSNAALKETIDATFFDIKKDINPETQNELFTHIFEIYLWICLLKFPFSLWFIEHTHNKYFRLVSASSNT
jgi:hypothetical protein